MLRTVRNLGRRISAAALGLCLASFAAALPASAIGEQVSIEEVYLFAGRNNDYYTEEAYWASPVVVDLDGDGNLEVLNAAYSLVVMDARTGKEKWRINSGKDRSAGYSDFENVGRQVFTDFKVTDLEGDGSKEIIIAYGNGSVSVLDNSGYFKPGWPQQPVPAASGDSLRSLAVGDLDSDGKQEIVVGAGLLGDETMWVYRFDGTLVSGWPQLSPEHRSGKITSVDGAFHNGMYGNAIALGDLDGDGTLEIIAPTDTQYVAGFHWDGSLLEAHPQYDGRVWGKIALYEDYDQETDPSGHYNNHGWDGDPMKAALGHCSAVLSDVDGDGDLEVAVTALMTDFTNFNNNGGLMTLADTRYTTVFLLNGDRSRYVNAELGFDWRSAPRDLGGCTKKIDDVSAAAGVYCEPVCSDLDGDGLQEILFNSYNGKLHCFSLDGQEHGFWPFTLPKNDGYICEFATPPVCVDINGDGTKEVIFVSWTDCDAGRNTKINGSLYVLDKNGSLLASKELHDAYATYEGVVSWTNGVTAAPTVYDIDGDGKYEVLLNTAYYALCAYKLDADNLSSQNTASALTESNMAYVSNQIVDVDGKKAEFNMYALKDANGNSTNYVRVRDVAYTLNETAAQFNVSWDGEVNLVSETPYDPNGSEMSAPFDGDRAYTLFDKSTKVDGKSLTLDAIVLTDESGGGYTYYKLRDLGKALGFNVGWSSENGIYIETDKPYQDQ